VHGIECNVGKKDHRARLISETIAKYNAIDILVSNAAVNPVYGDTLSVRPNVCVRVRVRVCFFFFFFLFLFFFFFSLSLYYTHQASSSPWQTSEEAWDKVSRAAWAFA
jgi:NAD(P)-dependent dehydrogenase (short-subunit alcohol dehydrogenase family)